MGFGYGRATMIAIMRMQVRSRHKQSSMGEQKTQGRKRNYEEKESDGS
jgi:hypothetical protein